MWAFNSFLLQIRFPLVCHFVHSSFIFYMIAHPQVLTVENNFLPLIYWVMEKQQWAIHDIRYFRLRCQAHWFVWKSSHWFVWKSSLDNKVLIRHFKPFSYRPDPKVSCMSCELWLNTVLCCLNLHDWTTCLTHNHLHFIPRVQYQS